MGHSYPNTGPEFRTLGRVWKIKKGVEVWCPARSFQQWGEGEEGGWHFCYLIFWSLSFFTFWNYFTLCKIVLYIWKRIFFFCQHNFVKKSHSKLSKNEPVWMCKEGWFVGLGQEGGFSAWRWNALSGIP